MHFVQIDEQTAYPSHLKCFLETMSIQNVEQREHHMNGTFPKESLRLVG